MNIQHIKPFKSLRNAFPGNVYGLMAHVAGSYGASYILNSIASVSKYNKNAKAMTIYSFGVFNYMLEVLSLRELANARAGIQIGQSINVRLFDYDALFVEDMHTNNPLILILPEGTNVTDYTDNWQYINANPKKEDISYESRQELFETIKWLMKETVLLDDLSIFYNPLTNDFKCLSSKGIIIADKILTTQEEDIYLKYYERQLFLKRERIDRTKSSRQNSYGTAGLFPLIFLN